MNRSSFKEFLKYTAKYVPAKCPPSPGFRQAKLKKQWSWLPSILLKWS